METRKIFILKFSYILLYRECIVEGRKRCERFICLRPFDSLQVEVGLPILEESDILNVRTEIKLICGG